MTFKKFFLDELIPIVFSGKYQDYITVYNETHGHHVRQDFLPMLLCPVPFPTHLMAWDSSNTASVWSYIYPKEMAVSLEEKRQSCHCTR